MKLSFGFFAGLFLILWGAFELGQQFGYIPSSIHFPWFPLALVFLGISMVVGRIFKN